MKRLVTSCIKPGFFSPDALADTTIISQVTAKATPTATRAVTGIACCECDIAKVMTPVIVPGLAANRIKGANDESAV